jgi:hypothetical protein
VFAGFQPSAFQNDAFQVGAFAPILAGGGGDGGKRTRPTKKARKKPDQAYYIVDNRIFTDATEAAEYAARFQNVDKPLDQAAEAGKEPQEETILSTVQIDDKEIAVKTVIPVKATKEFVADLVKAEIEKAQLKLRQEAEREELKVVSMILSMLFGDDAIIEMDTVPPAVQFGRV